MLMKIKRMRWLLLFMFYVSTHFTYSQHHYSFKKLTKTEGLSQSVIATIAQDPSGFIWVGTWKGLFKYDGYTFKPIDFGSDEPITALCFDKTGKLWVGTYDGLFIKDLRTGKSKKLVTAFRNLFVNSILSKENGSIYVASNKGILEVDTLSVRNPKLYKEKINGSRLNAYSLKIFKNDLYVGTDAGIIVLDGKDFKQKPSTRWISDATKNYGILQIQVDKENQLWMGTENLGILTCNLVIKSITHFSSQNTPGLISNWIRKIIVDHEGNVWIGTRSGLVLYKKASKSFIDLSKQSFFSYQIYDNKIWSIYEDRDYNIWVGNFVGEIFQYRSSDENFKYIDVVKSTEEGLKHPLVHSIAQDANRIWLGTFGGGLYYMDKEFPTAIKHFNTGGIALNKEIKTIIDDKSGNLWAGTTNGLYILNKTTGQTQYQDNENKASNTLGISHKLINVMLNDDEFVWVGTNGRGLYKVSKKDYSWTSVNTYNQNYLKVPITAFLNDGENVWIGSQSGLFKLNKKQNKIVRHYQSGTGSKALKKSWISTLFKDKKGNIWIGTERGGLHVLDSKADKIYRLNDVYDDFNKSIHTIIQDQQQIVWVSTDNGLYSINIGNQNADKYFSKSTKIRQYMPPSNSGNKYYLSNSGISLDNGAIIFGGMNGITVFDSHNQPKDKTKRPVVITAIDVPNDKEIGKRQSNEQTLAMLHDKKTLDFPSSVNTVTISFSSLDYSSADYIKYAYQLSYNNKESQWISTSNNNASFISLKPGTYTFKIKRVDYGEEEMAGITTLTFIIHPPFYLTTVAYLLYVLLFLGSAYIVFRFVRSKIILQRQLRQGQLEKKKQEELHALKMNFYTNISHEIRTPLSLITLPVEQLYKKENDPDKRQRLDTVRKNVDRMLSLINELLDFRKIEEKGIRLDIKPVDIVDFSRDIFEAFSLLAKERHITYDFLYNVDTRILPIDPAHIEKVLLNILSNAFKNTLDGGKVRLLLEEEYIKNNIHVLKIIVQDDGIGISKDHLEKIFDNFYQVPDTVPTRQGMGTGLGLSIVKEIIDLHKGKIYAKSEMGNQAQKGLTTFTVELKYDDTESLNVDDSVSRLDGSLSIEEPYPAKEIVTIDKKAKCILVVEDNKDLNELIVSSLEADGYKVINAFNGVEGLEIAQQKLPDLIISDVLMPEMNGLVFCAEIKQNNITSHIPVLLLTARNDQEHQLQGYQHGADAYIPKPFKEALLLLHIANVLKTREALQRANLTALITMPKDEEVKGQTKDQILLHKLMELIEKNLSNPSFSVEMLAKEIGMSKAVLYKKASALADTTIAELIKIARLKKAASMLEQQDISVSELTYLVGFSDPRYFSKEFKKYFGKSPSTYYKQN